MHDDGEPEFDVIRVMELMGGPHDGSERAILDVFGDGREPAQVGYPTEGGGVAWYVRGDDGVYRYAPGWRPG